MFLIMRNGGGFHRSFPAAAVGSRDSVRVLRLDGGSVFFDSVLSGQDVGESARGAARWAAPLH